MKDTLTIQNQQAIQPHRIELLDFLRGCGMLLVLLHHSDLPNPFGNWILSFHMPLLFLLSGYTLSLRPHKGSAKQFLVNRFLRLIVPYFLFEGLNLFVWSASLYFQGGWQDVTDAVSAIAQCVNTEGYTGYYGRLWFWPCMFVSDIFFYWIQRFAPRNGLYRKGYLLLMILAMFGISWYTAKAIPFRLPFTVDTAFMATAFLLSGYLFGQEITWILRKDHPIPDIVILLLSASAMFWAIPRCGASFMMFINRYGHYGYSACAAFGGILSFLILAKWLYGVASKGTVLKKTVLWYGYHSLATFPIHLSVKMWIYQSFPISYRKWYILLPAMFFLNVPLVNLVTKYFPFMLGKFPVFRKKQSNP